jgi:hypothetical protein
MRTRRDGSGAFARRERPIIVEPMGAGLCGITLQIAIGVVVSGVRVSEYISPSILACSLLWMRPRPPSHRLTRLKHRHEEHEVWHPPR